MKILSIGNFGTGWDGSICDEEHIAQAMEVMGHGVVRCQRENINIFNPENKIFGLDTFDFVLIAQWDGYSERQLRSLPRPLVYWAFDYQADSQDWHSDLIQSADLYLSKRIADQRYPNWCWLSQDFAPEFLEPYPEHLTQDIDVLFTGTYLDYATKRNETLKAIDDNFCLQINSVNPEAWTAAGFRDVNGPIMDQALPELIGRAKVNLSIDHTHEAGYWSDRTAQIMACGGFVLMRHVPLAEARFPEGVQFFHNTGHALTLIDEALNNPKARERLAEQGQYYASRYLKVDQRVKDLLTIVSQIL